jgi:transposase
MVRRGAGSIVTWRWA